MKRCVKYRFLRKNIAARSRFEVNFKPSCPYPTKINSVDIPHLDQKIIRQPNLLFFNAFQIQTKTQHNIWLILGDVQSLKIYPKKYRENVWENHFQTIWIRSNQYNSFWLSKKSTNISFMQSFIDIGSRLQKIVVIQNWYPIVVCGVMLVRTHPGKDQLLINLRSLSSFGLCRTG